MRFSSKAEGRKLVVDYNPTEVGLYVIHIKWSGEEVEVSPICVYVFDTYEELTKYVLLILSSLCSIIALGAGNRSSIFATAA